MKTKLLILTVALICALTLTSCTRDEVLPPVLNTAANASCILGETEDMGDGYIDSFVFFGESTTYHLKSRGVLSGGSSTTQVLGNKSGTAMLNSETSSMEVIDPKSGESVSLREAVRRNKPKYMLVSIEDGQALALTEDERIDIIAKRILNKHRKAFEELAK